MPFFEQRWRVGRCVDLRCISLRSRYHRSSSHLWILCRAFDDSMGGPRVLKVTAPPLHENVVLRICLVRCCSIFFCTLFCVGFVHQRISLFAYPLTNMFIPHRHSKGTEGLYEWMNGRGLLEDVQPAGWKPATSHRASSDPSPHLLLIRIILFYYRQITDYYLIHYNYIFISTDYGPTPDSRPPTPTRGGGMRGGGGHLRLLRQEKPRQQPPHPWRTSCADPSIRLLPFAEGMACVRGDSDFRLEEALASTHEFLRVQMSGILSISFEFICFQISFISKSCPVFCFQPRKSSFCHFCFALPMAI